MGVLPNDPFDIWLQNPRDMEWTKIALGGRVEIVSNMIGTLPLMTAGSGLVTFNKCTVATVKVYDVVADNSEQDDLLTGGLARKFNVSRRQMSDEHLIITALVRQLGGVASVSQEEIRTADKVTHMTSHHLRNPDRFLIKVED